MVIESLADQGRADEAEVLLAEFGMEGELVPNLFSTLPLLTRGRLRALRRAMTFARVRTSEEALRWMRLSRGLWPWMSEACVALVPVLRNLGDDAAARAAAEQAMQGATTSQPRRRLGGALRVAGPAGGR